MNRVQGNAVPGFTTKDLIEMQFNCRESKDQKDV